MASRIMIPKARLAFAHIFEKGQYQGEESTKYEATALIDREQAAKVVAQIKKVCKGMLEEKYGAKVPGEFKRWLDAQFGVTDKIFIRDGDNFSYDGYAGCWAIKAANKAQPKLLDLDKTRLTADDGKLYSGCYANMMIEPWIQDNSYGKRINANLLGLQHVAHGAAFGAGGNVPDDVEDEFEAVEGDPLDDADLEDDDAW